MQLKVLADELARIIADPGYSHEALGIWLSRHHVAVEAGLRRPRARGPAEVEQLMKRCQRGVGGRNALADAHDIMAECYGTLGHLLNEVERLQAARAWKPADVERATVAAYEAYHEGVIGCAEPPWAELPDSHKDRMRQSIRAAVHHALASGRE